MVDGAVMGMLERGEVVMGMLERGEVVQETFAIR